MLYLLIYSKVNFDCMLATSVSICSSIYAWWKKFLFCIPIAFVLFMVFSLIVEHIFVAANVFFMKLLMVRELWLNFSKSYFHNEIEYFNSGDLITMRPWPLIIQFYHIKLKINLLNVCYMFLFDSIVLQCGALRPWKFWKWELRACQLRFHHFVSSKHWGKKRHS